MAVAVTVWDLGQRRLAHGRLVATAQPAGEISARGHDEIGTLMVASTDDGTIEQQADEINQFPKLSSS